MLDYVKKVKDFQVPEGKTAVFWLGQAGFLIKTGEGTLCYVDPYFSNCCERHFGFRRLMPAVIGPKDIPADLLLVTHAHFDHLDIDSLDDFVSMDSMKIFAAKDTREYLEPYGLLPDRLLYLGVGDTAAYKDISVLAVKCDHGKLAPDALGFVIRTGNSRIYVAGDTAFRPDWFADPELHGADLFIAPINGAFGNMDSDQAVAAAKILQPKLTVPCHFWNFAEHGGDPMRFKEGMELEGMPYTLMSVYGDPVLI